MKKVIQGSPLSWSNWKGLSLPVRASVVTEEHNVKLVGSLPRVWFKMAKSFIVSLGPVIKVGPSSVSIVGTATVSDVKIISPRYSRFEGILL